MIDIVYERGRGSEESSRANLGWYERCRDAEMRMTQRMPKAKRKGPKKLPCEVKPPKGGDGFK